MVCEKTLYRQIENYRPFNEQEEKDQRTILRFMETSEHVLTRENEIAHFTASAWILNQEHTKVLMVYHNIYNSWSWTGGHADGEEDLLKVALREATEETGVTEVRHIGDDIFSLEIIVVDGHEKRGSYVSSHLHMNVTYLLEAKEELPLHIKEDENSGVAWFGIREAVEASTEPWMQERIYRKLNEKCRKNGILSF